MATNCNIANCRKLIVDELKNIFPSYKKIRIKLKKNLELNNTEKKQLQKINSYIDILIPQCENSDKIDTFKNIIKKTIS